MLKFNTNITAREYNCKEIVLNLFLRRAYYLHVKTLKNRKISLSTHFREYSYSFSEIPIDDFSINNLKLKWWNNFHLPIIKTWFPRNNELSALISLCRMPWLYTLMFVPSKKSYLNEIWMCLNLLKFNLRIHELKSKDRRQRLCGLWIFEWILKRAI